MSTEGEPLPPAGPAVDAAATQGPRGPLRSEDWWAVWLGLAVLLAGLAAVWAAGAYNRGPIGVQAERVRELRELARGTKPGPERKALDKEVRAAEKQLLAARNPALPWLGRPGPWGDDPLDAFAGGSALPGLAAVLLLCLAVFGPAVAATGGSFVRFAGGFAAVFLLAVLAYVLAEQEVISYYNLEYVLWALAVGLVISNTAGTPRWLRPAVRTELYIKTGLVLLGAEILLSRLLALGLPGVFVAWVVTPIVLVATYAFGQRVLRLPSKSLNMVISADMSVCGVSAAIATAAACKAKKEELSLAIALSLTFTAVMMVAMPALIRAAGMGEVLGGAWLGGTIDSTGAVAAAGAILGETALEVAATIKMIQNILIGVIAFAVAAYWVRYVERGTSAARPDAWEVWRRFPKFVLGFVAASVLFSLLYSSGPGGAAATDAVIAGTARLRGWFFCLAFVSIGLETDFRELSRHLHGGKPLVLYVCGQALNLALTLLMAWLMFDVVFPAAADALAR